MIRNTKQRDDVREALSRQDGFVSAQELHQQLHSEGSGVGLATVYRACRPGHHHHLVCRECGMAVEISAKPIEAWASDVAKEYGFIEPEHVVDVFGVCGQCHKTRTGN